ncbi:17175_t:CDS:1, partial [Acaulospora morrowiae]
DRDVTLDYVEFMKILNISLDKEIRPKYTEHYYTGFLVYPNYSNRDLMVYMILKTFMTRCPKLERISIDLRRIYTRGPKEYICSELKKERAPRLDYRHLPTEIYETLHSYSGDGPCLKQLSEVVCVTRRRKTSLLLSLTKFAPNIKYLVTTIAYGQHFLDGDLERNYEKPKVEEEAASLATLIQSQKALSHFGLHTCSEGLPVVMSALKSQINSLSSLSFVNMKNLNYKVLIGIKPLKMLQKLSFQLCTFQPDGPTFRSTNPEFPCLTELDLSGTYASDEMLENLLLMCPSAL